MFLFGALPLDVVVDLVVGNSVAPQMEAYRDAFIDALAAVGLKAENVAVFEKANIDQRLPDAKGSLLFLGMYNIKPHTYITYV